MAAADGSAEVARVLVPRADVGLIRIVLAELPRMLRDIVRAAVEVQDDMRIVSEAGGSEATRVLAARGDVDVVITGLADGELPSAYASLLYDRPDLKVLALTGDARQIALFELRPHRIDLGDVSPDGLVSAIRDRAGVRAL
jgi:DNA-binding NarL/FixJ family response regulator